MHRAESDNLLRQSSRRTQAVGDKLSYEVAQSQGTPNEWRVEAINHAGDGEVYVTLFSGPDAQARAEEYAAWKNQ